MSHGVNRKNMAIRVWVLAILGPLIAMLVTWQSSLAIANIGGGAKPPQAIVQELRLIPTDEILEEINEISVGAYGLGGYKDDEIIAAADAALNGRWVFNDGLRDITVPDKGIKGILNTEMGDLQFCSLIVPNLFARAFKISGETKYLQEAVRYVLGWSEFESSMIVPSSCVFNDHATAARAIVVTEIWRLYRNSEIYDAFEASYLLQYVQKLSHLLMYPALYEYRTNHGIMQNLSLLHLAIAFPLLQTSESSWEVGKSRLLSQLEYYINEEGVILEHSPGYHQNGLRRLAAAWRYLGLMGDAVPQDLASRYRKGLDFQAALRRPDRTLPLIGDTDDHAYSPIQVASFDGSSVVSTELRHEPSGTEIPNKTTAAPGAGWIVLWDGLKYWPNAEYLAQTVFHWGNFPTKAHKHADELAISIWSGGVQWVRGVGYWPYERSRIEAIGWRSSNGPHWLNESATNNRHSSLVGSVIGEAVTFLNVLRTTEDGAAIRRQLIKIHDDTWILFDSFESATPGTAEVLWRLSPAIVVGYSSETEFALRSTRARQIMYMLVDGSGEMKIETDLSGSTEWNSGLMDDYRIGKSPAIRLTSSDTDVVIVTVFRLDNTNEENVGSVPVTWRWKDAAHWQVAVAAKGYDDVSVERRSNVLRVTTDEATSRAFEISTAIAETAAAPRQSALQALHRDTDHYGTPYQPMMERRAKVTVFIVVTAVAQLILFFLVRLKEDRLWRPLAICSSVAWIGFSLYLGTSFLV